MGIFTKTKKVEVVDQPANYYTALDYLIGLSGEDYTKICQVAAIHRQANFEACSVLGVDYQPTTSISEPESIFKGKSLAKYELKYEKLPKKSKTIKRGKK